MENQVELQYKEITDKILHAFFKIVYAKLGYGFLEKVYENSLALVLQSKGLKVQQHKEDQSIFPGLCCW